MYTYTSYDVLSILDDPYEPPPEVTSFYVPPPEPGCAWAVAHVSVPIFYQYHVPGYDAPDATEAPESSSTSESIEAFAGVSIVASETQSDEYNEPETTGWPESPQRMKVAEGLTPRTGTEWIAFCDMENCEVLHEVERQGT